MSWALYSTSFLMFSAVASLPAVNAASINRAAKPAVSGAAKLVPLSVTVPLLLLFDAPVTVNCAVTIGSVVTRYV